MLTVNHRNWFFKWAYLINFQDTRDAIDVTTLCSLFWRSAVLTPLKLCVLSSPVVGMGYWIGVTDRETVREVIVLVVWVVGGMSFAIHMDNRARAKRERDEAMGIKPKPPKPSFIGETIRGIKERYCPLVRVER